MDYSDERLWAEKYQPKRLDEMDYNDNITKVLKALSTKDDFSHMIFYGAEGAGKKTRIRAFLAEIFGLNVNKINTEFKEFKVNSVSVEYRLSSSAYHIELTPSESEFHDRHVVQRVIKETASNLAFDFNKNSKNFKIVVLYDVDNLTKEAQASLRRTMEKYMSNCRLILSCNSLTNVMAPIRSRCLSLRVPSPNNDEIKKIIYNIRKREKLEKISDQQIDLILMNSDNNLRRAINMLQITYFDSNNTKDIFIPEYILSIKGITDELNSDQSPNTLKKLRESILKLLINVIPIDIIIYGIAQELTFKYNKYPRVIADILSAASLYDVRAKNGSKGVMHIEAYLAKVMLIISEFKTKN